MTKLIGEEKEGNQPPKPVCYAARIRKLSKFQIAAFKFEISDEITTCAYPFERTPFDLQSLLKLTVSREAAIFGPPFHCKSIGRIFHCLLFLSIGQSKAEFKNFESLVER